jgi:hypothetical protein
MDPLTTPLARSEQVLHDTLGACRGFVITNTSSWIYAAPARQDEKEGTWVSVRSDGRFNISEAPEGTRKRSGASVGECVFCPFLCRARMGAQALYFPVETFWGVNRHGLVGGSLL